MKLLLTAPSIIATENPADISIISSRTPWGQPAVLATPSASRSTPRTFTSQSKRTSGSDVFWRCPIPELTTSFSRGCLMLTYLPLLCVTQTLLCTADIAVPCNKQGYSPSEPCLVDAGLGSSAHVWHQQCPSGHARFLLL